MLNKHLSLLLAVTIIFLSVSSFSVCAETSDDSAASVVEETMEPVLNDDTSFDKRNHVDIADTGAAESCSYLNGHWIDKDGYVLMVPGDTADFSIPTAYKIISSDISVECGTSSVASCTYKTNNVFTIMAKATGTSTVHASVTSSYTYYDVSLKRNITYSSKDYLDTGVRVVEPVTSISSPKTINMIEGDVSKLTLTSEPDSSYSRGASNIKYYSYNTNVVKVDSHTGELTAQGPGTTTVTASASVSGFPSTSTTVNVTSAFQTANSGSGITITKYIGKKSKLKIPTSLTNKTVNGISDSAFKGVTSLTEVTVPATVTRIGASAFSGCGNLQSIFIPRSVTQIGSAAFSGCSSDLVIKCAYGSAAYQYAINNGISYSLYGLMIDYLTEEQTSDSSLWGNRYLYDYGGSASYLTLSNTTSNVSNIIDGFGTYRILSGAFKDNKNIKMVTINKGGVLSIGDHAFSGCTKMEFLKVNTTDVIFGEDVVEKSVIIIGHKGSTAEQYALSHGNPFMNWLDFSINSDGSVSIEALSDPYVENDVLVFPDSIGTHKVTEILKSNMLYPQANTLILPDTVERIGEEAFSRSAFTRAYLGKNLKEIGNQAFFRSSLRSIELPDSLVKLGSGVFDNCTNLKTVKVGNGLTSIGGFYQCSNLKQVILGSNVKTIEASTFWECSSLEYINLENVSSSIGNRAFWGCTSLRWFHLSDQLNKVGEGAFEGADVSGVIIPKSVTEIGRWAFGYTDANHFAKGNTHVNSDNIRISGFKINGYSGTAAQTYANQYGFSFIDLGSGREPDLKNYGTIKKEVYIKESTKQLYCYTTKEDGTPNRSMPGYKMDRLFGTLTNTWFIYLDENDETATFYDGNSNLIYGPVDIKNYQHTNIIMSSDTITQSGDISYIYDEEPVPVTHVALNQSSAQLDVDEKLSLSATVSPTNADDKAISWSSNNPSVATVDSSGKITALSPGTAYITAVSSNYLFAFCKITVKNKPEFEYRLLSDGTAEITAYHGSSLDIVIPEKIEGKTVTSIGNRVFYNNETIETVTLPETITNLDECSFGLCTNLNTINLPDSIKTIKKHAFYGDLNMDCTDLPSELEEIGYAAFSYCKPNTHPVVLPEKLTKIGDFAFFDTIYQYNITIPKSATAIGTRAFGYFKKDDSTYKLFSFFVKGYTDSEAQRYAMDNSFTFISLDEFPTQILGDADGNGNVSVNDITHILRFNASNPVPVTLYFATADVNRDKYINVFDATLIQRWLAKIDSVSDIGKRQ